MTPKHSEPHRDGEPAPPIGPGSNQPPPPAQGAPDPVNQLNEPTDALYFVTHDNLPANKGWWQVRIREWHGEPNTPIAQFFADLCPNAELRARNIATELNELAAQKKDA
jgi:hypothetical protein